MNAAELRKIASNPILIEVARKKLEDQLIDLRDSCIGLIGPGNGLVVRSENGEPSSIIRIRTTDAIRIALETIADQIEEPINVKVV